MFLLLVLWYLGCNFFCFIVLRSFVMYLLSKFVFVFVVFGMYVLVVLLV